MSVQAYSIWYGRYHQAPRLARFLARLPEISIASRKVLLAITRVQTFPSFDDYGRPRNRIARRFVTELQTIIVFHHRYPRKKEETPQLKLIDIINPISTYFECPLLAGLISVHIRSAPYYSYTDVEQVAQETLEKELTASLVGYQRFSSDFRCILSYSGRHRDLPFAPNIPPNPKLAGDIFMSLLSVKYTLRGKRIYPRVARKTFHSGVAAKILEDLRKSHPGEVFKVETIADLEQVYYRTGWRPEGEVEMRSAWKYNDLKPRVYYAQGPSCYNASLYIQPIFNALLDGFEVCHRILRFSDPSVSLEDAFLYIYDYSSFTSSLTESTRFIFALADFFDDVDVEILDTREGWSYVSVGSLLRQYAQTCNVDPPFSVHRLLPSEGLCAIRFHNCGMLGVPGNLASCTVLHAINLMFLSGSMFASRCVGDDGMAISVLPRDEFVDGVCNMGDVAEEKTEMWSPDWGIVTDFRADAWHFTKRPIYRNFDKILRGELFIYPSLELVLQLEDEYHRSSLPTKDIVRHRKVNRQVLKLLQDVASNHQACTDEGLEILLMTLANVYHTMGWSRSGQILRDPKDEGASVVIGRMPTSKEELELDPYKRNCLEMVGQTITVPLMRYYDDPFFDPPCSFIARGSASLSVLEAIGVIRTEKLLLEQITIEDDSLLYQVYLKAQYMYSYEYSVLNDLPSWCR